MKRIFLLSPAYCAGKRARLLLNDHADFSQAKRVRTKEGISIGEVFSFLSGLYFRGKLAYAKAFAQPPLGMPGVLVITPSRGLLSPEESVTIEELREFAGVDIQVDDRRYRRPLERDARRLAMAIGAHCETILLGSIATGKYLDILSVVLGERLRFPAEFVGRGDMSRGALLLRCVESRRELEYSSFLSANQQGPRPRKLAPRHSYS